MGVKVLEQVGVHLFQIGMREGIIESLEKAQEYFINIEEYERAVETRDLIKFYSDEYKERYRIEKDIT
jgi:protein-arginine kinase activator protein McsA